MYMALVDFNLKASRKSVPEVALTSLLLATSFEREKAANTPIKVRNY